MNGKKERYERAMASTTKTRAERGVVVETPKPKKTQDSPLN